MKQKTTHKKNINALNRIEGQIKGVKKMIEDEKYCVDIVIQIHAAIHALYRVGEKVFEKHVGHCVQKTFSGKSAKEKEKKMSEMMKVIKIMSKLG